MDYNNYNSGASSFRSFSSPHSDFNTNFNTTKLKQMYMDSILQNISPDDIPQDISIEDCEFHFFDIPQEIYDSVEELGKLEGIPCLEDIETAFIESKEKNPSSFLNSLNEAIKDEKKGTALHYQKDGKHQYIVAPQHKKYFENEVQIKQFDAETSQIKAETLQQDSFTITVFTEEQYARITNAATSSLSHLSKELRAHERKMKEAEESGEYPLSKKNVNHENEGPRKFLKDSMKNLILLNESSRKKKESREQQLREEQLAQEARDTITRRTKRDDLKFEQTQQQIRRDEVKKAEEQE